MMWRLKCVDPSAKGLGRIGSIAAALTLVLSAPLSAKDEGPLHLPSPDWRDQIVYSLMIDRFEDGDPTNNDQGENEYRRGEDPYFNGGDLAGIKSRVPYLDDLGVTAVWISPPTRTQWWDPATQYSGYHGYWPVHFKQVDPHFGTLAEYQALSRALHGRGMYLIQDVVVNQIGHYYNYKGGYDPSDETVNFNLVEGAVPPRPLMYPFDLVNRLDPVHAAADVYHWTPTITDYDDPDQQYDHQLQLMNDLNTSNPLVRDALKSSYGHWIKQAGVDAFRVDAAKHVEADFLYDFLHGPDGIMETAKSTGREDFLTFGEIFNFSDPMQVNAEKQIVKFMGTAERPQLGSVINFPLKEEMRRVFARAAPTSLLAYRLQEQARQFESSPRWPTFVNNHDVQRFLSVGSKEGYRLAYLLLMTAPGIPVVYQGDELGFTQVRRAIFDGAGPGGAAAFDKTSDDFQFLKSVIHLRKSNPPLRRGSLTVLQENPTAPGILAYKREYEGEAIYVLINSAAGNRALVSGLQTKGGDLEIVHAIGIKANTPVKASADGLLTFTMPPSSSLVLRERNSEAISGKSGPSKAPVLNAADPVAPKLKAGDALCGSADRASDNLLLLINGNLDTASALKPERNGQWCVDLPQISLDAKDYTAQVYDPAQNKATPAVLFNGQGGANMIAQFADPENDDRGPSGSYKMLTDAPNHRAGDIRSVTARANDEQLELVIEVAQISNVWNYINGFDHTAFSIFIDAEPAGGISDLPGMFAQMPKGAKWDVNHRLFGMGSTIHTSEGAAADQLGKLAAGRPEFQIDYANRTVTILYERSSLDIDSWENARIYIATWDADEFGRFRELGSEATAGQIGGGAPDDPRILDDVMIALPESSAP
ncbi:MAG: alpha-amylase family glycosyl hydrolase [Pseudomonadota bacterium]